MANGDSGPRCPALGWAGIMSLAMSRPAQASKRTGPSRPLRVLAAPFTRAGHAIGGKMRPFTARLAAAARRNPRLTIMMTVSVICICFMAAMGVAVERAYSGALDDAEASIRAQAAELAAEAGNKLDRIAALSVGYLNAIDERSAATVVAGEADAILNIALVDASGHFVAALHGGALQAKPLSPAAVAAAMRAHVVASYRDPAIGTSPLTLVFRTDRETPARFAVVVLNPASVMPAFATASSALLTVDGGTLALSAGWRAPPPAYALRARPNGSDIRYVEADSGRRIVALTSVPGWPLAAATSVRAVDALAGWYAALPVYIFLLLGIPLAGAALAFVLLRAADAGDEAGAGAIPHRVMVHARETALRTRLADAERRSLEAERAKAEFLAHMSHELRTPLNAIAGFAEIIEQGMFGPAGHDKYSEYAGDISRAARSLHQRIGEILELAAMAAENQELDGIATDASAVARACVDQVRGFAQARGIKLDAALPALTPARADATAIKRIMIVLLSNALRFTRDKGTVDITAREEDDAIVLAVRDSGQGASDRVSPEGTPPRGVQRERERDRSYGLGLAMAMALARRMGGSLRMSGALDGGAAAELRLPLARPKVQAQQEVKRAS